MNLLNNKTIIVTGASKGIGLEMVKLFTAEGAKVIAISRSGCSIMSENVENVTLDVSNYSKCETIINELINKYKKIDGLVCNAGVTADKMTYKMAENDFDMVIDINLKGAFNIIKWIGPFMEKQGYGSIVTISSIVGEYGNIGQCNYAASKAGLIGMTKSWAKEFSRKGAQVRANVVCPGYIMTDMLKTVPEELLVKFRDLTMLKRLGNPKEIAQTALFLLSDMSSYVTGAVIDVNGGMRL